jgi:hypothetical protein
MENYHHSPAPPSQASAHGMTGIRMAGIEDYPHAKTNRAEGKGEGHDNDELH